MKKKLTIRLFTLLLALVMVLPSLPIFAEETTTATEGTENVTTAEGETATATDTTTGEESTDTPGTETKPEEDYKLPPFDEQTESIPDTFEFDDNMWYIAYKNTTTYSLVRSKNAMVVVKAKLLEIQETFFKPVRSFSHRADRFG